MFKGAKVLDVHSHIHDIPMTDRTQRPRFGTPFLNTLFGIPGLGASKPLPSPIGAGKHSDQLGNRDEDFQAVAAALVKYMDVRNIDTQIMSPHPLVFHGWMEDDILFRSWISYQNDLAFKIVQAQPSRFVGSCWVPQRPREKDTAHCVEELERCVKELACVAVYISPDPTGKGDTPTMNMPYWFPLYEKCQELNIPIIIHGSDTLDPRFHTMNVSRYFEFNFIPPQSMAYATLRANPQVFERFPGLKIINCHCGSFIDRLGPGAAYRVQEKDLSKNMFYDTAAYDLDFIALAIKQRGASQFAYGTEAPGSGTEIRPGTEYTADDLVPMFDKHPTLSFLSEKEKLDILHNTPAKLAPGLADAAAQNAKARVKAY